VRERSLRFRLTLWYALVLCAALTLLSGLIWISLRQRLLNEVDQNLSDSAARLEAYLAKESSENPPVDLIDELEEFCQALPPSDYVQLRGARGFALDYPDHAPPAQDRRSLSRRFRVGAETFDLQISSSLTAIDHTLDLLRILLLGLVPLIVTIACAGGAWLSRRALKPVDEITAAARGIGIDNLSLRLRTPQTGDELQRLTEVWNSMLARLEEAVRTLSQFAADASHELRTPLAVIRTSAELALRRARSPETYRESLMEIAQEADSMTRLVEDLLFLARSDARAAEMPLEPVDCGTLLRKVCDELHGVADARRVRIRRVLPSHAALISGNPAALQRLFLVLIDNAIKYSHPDSEIVVALECTPGHVRVSVQDFGIGIGANDQPHIFRRFYQADKSRSDEGFGLGLSLAESIATAHNATIRVTSEEGRGAAFRVEFAAALSATPAVTPEREINVGHISGR
jgi:signal transduction histidine kinase